MKLSMPRLLTGFMLLLSAGCAGITKSTEAQPLPTTQPTASLSSTQPPEPTPAAYRYTPLPEALEQDFARRRAEMVEDTIASRGVRNSDVLDAMRTTPRHLFVNPNYIEQSYADHPLPIGYGQTISQPYIVAWMTELLDLKPGERVLEIGTGSGYQAAVLAELGYVEVYSMEIIPELAQSAAQRLAALGYPEVKVRQGDGYYGWEEFAPYDAIVITAAPDHLPAPLVAQLKEGGRIVVPIGPPGGFQSLWKFINQGGELKAYNLGGVMFVPLTGEGISQDHAEPTP